MRQYCFNEGMGDPLSSTDLKPHHGGNINASPCTLNSNLTQSYANGYNYSHNK